MRSDSHKQNVKKLNIYFHCFIQSCFFNIIFFWFVFRFFKWSIATEIALTLFSFNLFKFSQSWLQFHFQKLLSKLTMCIITLNYLKYRICHFLSILKKCPIKINRICSRFYFFFQCCCQKNKIKLSSMYSIFFCRYFSISRFLRHVWFFLRWYFWQTIHQQNLERFKIWQNKLWFRIHVLQKIWKQQIKNAWRDFQVFIFDIVKWIQKQNKK